MYKRAYRPEAPALLEERSLLSGGAGPPVHPVSITHDRRFLITDHMRAALTGFIKDRDLTALRQDIDDVVVMIPFAHADGLDRSIHGALNRLRSDLQAGAPHALRSARDAVLAMTRRDIAARVRAGDVVVR